MYSRGVKYIAHHHSDYNQQDIITDEKRVERCGLTTYFFSNFLLLDVPRLRHCWNSCSVVRERRSVAHLCTGLIFSACILPIRARYWRDIRQGGGGISTHCNTGFYTVNTVLELPVTGTIRLDLQIQAEGIRDFKGVNRRFESADFCICARYGWIMLNVYGGHFTIR